MNSYCDGSAAKHVEYVFITIIVYFPICLRFRTARDFSTSNDSAAVSHLIDTRRFSFIRKDDAA